MALLDMRYQGDAWDWLVDYRHMDKREAWQLLLLGKAAARHALQLGI